MRPSRGAPHQRARPAARRAPAPLWPACPPSQKAPAPSRCVKQPALAGGLVTASDAPWRSRLPDRAAGWLCLLHIPAGMRPSCCVYKSASAAALTCQSGHMMPMKLLRLHAQCSESADSELLPPGVPAVKAQPPQAHVVRGAGRGASPCEGPQWEAGQAQAQGQEAGCGCGCAQDTLCTRAPQPHGAARHLPGAVQPIVPFVSMVSTCMLQLQSTMLLPTGIPRRSVPCSTKSGKWALIISAVAC